MTRSALDLVNCLRLECLLICSVPIPTKVCRIDLSGRVDPLKINVIGLIKDKFPDMIWFVVLNLLPNAAYSSVRPDLEPEILRSLINV
jgi:hypothetical protein